MTRTCEAERQWSGSEPSCERKKKKWLCLSKKTHPRGCRATIRVFNLSIVALGKVHT